MMEALWLTTVFEDVTLALPPPDFWPFGLPCLGLWQVAAEASQHHPPSDAPGREEP